MSDTSEKACRFIAESLGCPCPHEMFDWEGDNCSHEKCRDTDDIWQCWREYFEGGGE